MSESVISDSAPTSTADVAANVIDAFDATETSGSGTEISGETPAPALEAGSNPDRVRELEPEAKAAPATAKELSESAKLLEKAGYQKLKADGRENWIPYSKVERIIENGLNEGKGKFGERFAALETEASGLRAHLDGLRASVAGDPRAFLAELAQIDARYQAFLQPQAAPPPQPQPQARMPEPDLRLPDGSSTFSLQGIEERLIPWLEQKIEARLVPKMDERLKPWAERDKAEQERGRRDAATQQIRQRYQTTMQEAQTWPGFGQLATDGTLTEFQTEVLAELQKDTAAAKTAGRRPTMTMREAYLEVHARRLSTDHNKVRESVLKELNGAPRSTGVPRGGNEQPRSNGTAVSTQDIAARTLARLEGKG